MIIVFVLSFALIALLVVKKAASCQKPVKAAALSAISGGAALFAVSAILPIIEINIVTAAAAVILGIPGVITILLLKIII